MAMVVADSSAMSVLWVGLPAERLPPFFSPFPSYLGLHANPEMSV